MVEGKPGLARVGNCCWDDNSSYREVWCRGACWVDGGWVRILHKCHETPVSLSGFTCAPSSLPFVLTQQIAPLRLLATTVNCCSYIRAWERLSSQIPGTSRRPTPTPRLIGVRCRVKLRCGRHSKNYGTSDSAFPYYIACATALYMAAYRCAVQSKQRLQTSADGCDLRCLLPTSLGRVRLVFVAQPKHHKLCFRRESG